MKEAVRWSCDGTVEIGQRYLVSPRQKLRAMQLLDDGGVALNVHDKIEVTRPVLVAVRFDEY